MLYVSLMEQEFIINNRYSGDCKELNFTGDRPKLILQRQKKLNFAGDKELNFAGDRMNLILQEIVITEFFRREKELNFVGDSKNFAGDMQNLIFQETGKIKFCRRQ